MRILIIADSLSIITRFDAVAMIGMSLVLFLSGCTSGPGEHNVREAIYAHFKVKNMQVVELDIQKIEREPLGQRKYMGPERHMVSVNKVILKPLKGEGNVVVHKGIVIIMRKKTDSLYGWHVDDIRGIRDF